MSQHPHPSSHSPPSTTHLPPSSAAAVSLPAVLSSKGLHRVDPPGLRLPPGLFACNDGSVYDDKGQFRGRIQKKGTAAAKRPPAAAPELADPSVSTPNLRSHPPPMYHPPSVSGSASGSSARSQSHIPPPQLQIPSIADSGDSLIVDGRDFGLPAGNFISSRDGRVFNSAGKAIGRMQGWNEIRHKLNLTVAIASNPLLAQGQEQKSAESPTAVASSHSPNSALAAQSKALSAISRPLSTPRQAHLTAIQELAPTPESAVEEKHVEEEEDEQSPQPQSPAPSDRALHLDQSQLADSYIDGNRVIVDGLVVGHFNDAGEILDEANQVLGHVPHSILMDMRARQAEEAAHSLQPVEDRIRALLTVQNYHDAEDRLASVYESLFSAPSKHRRKSSATGAAHHDRRSSVESQGGGNGLVISIDDVNPAIDPLLVEASGDHARQSSIAGGEADGGLLDSASIHASALRRRSMALAESSHNSHHARRSSGSSAAAGHTLAVSPHDIEDWVELHIDESELNSQEDPPIGLFPENFDQPQFDARRESFKFVDVIPSRFQRPKLHFTFPNNEKIINSEIFFTLFQPQSMGFNPLTMKMLWVPDLVGFLQRSHHKLLDKTISQLVNLTVLGLPNAGITRLDVVLPHLLCLDLSRNQIHHVSDIQKTLNCAIDIQAINLLDNPICDGFLESAHNHNGLPPLKSELWIPLLNSPDLTHFNSIPIANSIRALAYQKYHNSSQLNKNVNLFLFNHALNVSPLVLSMEKEFQPELVHTLHLENCGLFYFSVYSIRNSLQELRISHNHISDLSETGLTHCTKLTILDISHNALKDSKHDFEIYSLITSLMDLDVTHNHYPAHYEDSLVYACRNLPGSNRSPGLRSLNGKVLSIEDRVQAVVKIEHDSHHKREDEYRWQLSVVRCFGSLQLRSIDGFVSRVKSLNLSGCSLSKVFGLEKFESLERLDLSHNNLITIDLLETLRSIRVLKLNGNKHLKEESVMKQLESFTQLEQIWLYKEYKHSRGHHRNSSVGAHGGSSGNVITSMILSKEAQREKEIYGHISLSWFRKILAALAINNHKLSVIDGVAISLNERIHLQRELNPHFQGADLQKFKLNMALLYCCTPILGRDYLPANWSHQYEPGLILEMNLSHLELSSDQLDFSHFHSLQYLDLSHNRLTDLTAMNIRQLSNLTWLDCSHNKINTELSAIGLLVNDLTKLAVFIIRENPIMHHRDSRLRLLSTIDRMKELACELRVVDTIITLDEKMKSIAIGGVFSFEEVEDLRFQVAIRMRGPNSEVTPNVKVKELNFNDLGLRTIRLATYPNLTKLLLAHNQLESLKNTGIQSLHSLIAFDCRNNILSDLDETIEFINTNLKKLIYLGLDGNRFSMNSNSSYYRKHTINNLKALKGLEPTLVYLDEIEISGSEIADSWLSEGGDRRAVENLRFQLAIHKALHHHYTIANIQTLDLSHASLSYCHFEGFLELRKINLSHNSLDSESLMASRLSDCRKLAHIIIQFNEVHSIAKLGELFNSMYSLRSLDVLHNRCFMEDSLENRAKLLSFFPNSRKRGFRLKILNGKDISIDERVEACRIAELDGRAEEGEAEYIKTLLILESKKLDPNEKANLLLDLSGFQLKNVFAITQFKFIQYLNISNNSLSQLDAQGLERLRFLSTLNLRNNQFPSLEGILETLTHCPKLQSLYIENSTTDGKTHRISDKLVSLVCGKLRGLRSLDEQKSPFALTGQQLNALHFLNKLCGLHSNHLIDIDIAGLHISEDYFFFILSALSELKCCQTMHAMGNQWNQSKLHALYRVYCIFALGEQLRELDGFEITDSERLNALKKLNKDAAAHTLALEPWEKCCDRALAKVNGAAHMLQTIKEKQRQKAADKKGRPVEEEQKEQKIEMVGEGKMKRTVVDEKLDDLAFEDISPLVAVADANSDNIAMSGDEILHTITGTVLTKCEIAIHFLQVFDLILFCDLNVAWPQSILDFAVWVKVFTLNIDSWFKIKIPEKQQLKFAVVMILPALCLAFYGVLSTLNKNQWVKDYIENWSRTKWRAFGIWFVACLAGVLLPMFADPESAAMIKRGEGVKSNNKSIIAVVILLFTLIGFVWSLVVRTFRRHYIADESVGKNELFVWFLDKLQWWRQVSLFFTTILFLPVSRVILSQFQCWCPGDTDDPITDDSGVSYPYCQIEIYPGQKCFPTSVTAIQIFALVFGIIYILGIPYFFYRLIKYGIESMVDRHGYLEEAALVEEAVEQLKSDSLLNPAKAKENKKLIQRLDTQLKEFYYNRVNQNRAPQTYLYAAYERHFRYWKLGQMGIKFILICISFFLPRYFLNTFKILIANIMVGGYAFISFMSRPFNSDLEDVMEVFSQSGNLVNAAFAYLIGAQKITSATSGTLLVIVNVGVIVILLIGIIFTPCIAIRANRKYKKEMKQHAATHRLVLTKLPSGKIEVKEVSAKEAIEMTKTPRANQTNTTPTAAGAAVRNTKQPTAAKPAVAAIAKPNRELYRGQSDANARYMNSHPAHHNAPQQPHSHQSQPSKDHSHQPTHPAGRNSISSRNFI